MSNDFFNEPGYGAKDNPGSHPMIWAIAVIFIMIFAGCIFFANSIETPPNPKVDECKSNILQLGNALLAYINENDGTIPGMDINGEPYWQLAETLAKDDDSEKPRGFSLKCYSDTTGAPTSYLLNAALSGKSLDEIQVKDRPRTALLYERPTRKYHRWAFFLDGVVRPYSD